MLKGLTAARLAALNHGSIRTPIEGREGQEVLRRCRTWAAEIGEIKISDEPNNPTITLQLAAVDTDSILANAERIDNTGNRRRKIRELLFRELGIEDRDELMLQHEVTWRGTPRRFEVIFSNVRELADESLAARGDERKVVIDFPFDEPGHTPADDLARLDNYRQDGKPARTLVWLPSFLSVSAQRDLGTLVKLDYVLAGERLRDYATHLSPVDQASARELPAEPAEPASAAARALPRGCVWRGEPGPGLNRRITLARGAFPVTRSCLCPATPGSGKLACRT